MSSTRRAAWRRWRIPASPGKDDAIRPLAAAGLDALEVFHSDHPPETQADVPRDGRIGSASRSAAVPTSMATAPADTLGGVTCPRPRSTRWRPADAASMTGSCVGDHGVGEGPRRLRPAAHRELASAPHERDCSLAGLDAPAAEMLVGLATGAGLPDEGDVRLFGKDTREIGDVDAWLAIARRARHVHRPRGAHRSVTVAQNLAMPFTLDVDPVTAGSLSRRCTRWRVKLGLDESVWDRPVGATGAEAQARVKLGRAIALQPRLLMRGASVRRVLPREAVPAARGRIARRAACRCVAADEAVAGPGRTAPRA